MAEENKDRASKFTIKAHYKKEPGESHQLEYEIDLDGNHDDLLMALTKLMEDIFDGIGYTLDDVVKKNKTNNTNNIKFKIGLN